VRSAGSALPPHDPLATRTSQLGTNLADHFEAQRFDFQHLRNIFAEMLQLATAVRASFLLREIGSHFRGSALARPPYWPRRLLGFHDCFRESSDLLRIVLLQCLEPELQLLDRRSSFSEERPNSCDAAWRSAASAVRSRRRETRSVHAGRRSALSVRWIEASRSGSVARAAVMREVCMNKFRGKSIVNNPFHTAICDHSCALDAAIDPFKQHR